MHSAESIFCVSESIALVGQISSQILHFVQLSKNVNLNTENLDKKASKPPKGHRLRHQNLGAIKPKPRIVKKKMRAINVSMNTAFGISANRPAK